MDAELLVRLILLLPLAGAVINGVATLWLPGFRRQEAVVGGLATLMVAIPFVSALALFLPTLGHHAEAHVVHFFTWMQVGDLDLSFAYRVDQLSLIMTLVVTGVGSLIHLYSVGYMHDDPGYSRFFAYLNLFIFMMLNLVLADNLPVLFLGWEGVGLCSYLLIGFWYTDLKNSAAANKAFIVNRVGDFAFLLAMFIIYQNVGALDYDSIFQAANLFSPETAPAWVDWAVLLLFFGATGKSAQIPLFVWLPDAMAGPTPVSALIHAATMVTSGLYLLARLSSVVLLAPAIMVVIAVVAAITCIMAASIAIAQNDIKKVLAYSTVSQLGYMFMAAGVGAFFVAIFHVMTHAFFKACLFLGSGSVIHSMHGVEHELEHKGVVPPHDAPDTPMEQEAQKDMTQNPLPYEGPFDPQDMRTMGGLKKWMPSTRWTYLIATFAIAGFPLVTAGFYSKDEILFKAFEFGAAGAGYAWFVWGVGVLTALLTAFYMMRSYMLTFEGEPRWPLADEVHPHESPSTMTIPLWVLAGLSIVGGFVGIPSVIGHLVHVPNWIHHYLGAAYGGPVSEPAVIAAGEEIVSVGTEWFLILLGSAIAIVGLGVGYTVYKREGVAYDAKLKGWFGGLYRAWEGKYYWDEAYDRTVVRTVIGGARSGLAPFDSRIVDGIVNGVAYFTRGIGRLLSFIQTGRVQTYAAAIVVGVALVLWLIVFE